MTVISVLNETTTVTNADLALWVNAIQHQLLTDVAPFWPDAANFNLILVPQGRTAPPATWQVLVAENTDIANDLGYHEGTTSFLPLAKVFAQTTRGFRQTISRVLSHEIIEMIVDPTLMMRVTIGGTTYAVEAADQVNLDSCGYDKLGVLVSNFVTPRYYGLPSVTSDPRNDFCGQLSSPCPFLQRGGALTVVQPNGSLAIHQAASINSDNEIAAMAIHPGSRRYRRQMDRADWRPSRR
jgi:hypothetical protein